MAIVTHTTTLPDSANKSDFYAIVDNATVTEIVNNDISATAGITEDKLGSISTAGKVNITALIATSQSSGDIIYYDGSIWNRLPVGTAGQTLTVAAGLPSWA